MKRKSKGDAAKMREQCSIVSGILKSLAHPSRLLILCFLCERPYPVGELVELCAVSQSAVSQFLARLKEEGIVDSEKMGQHVFYRIRDSKIQALISSMQSIFC
jgi:DNA-binding transcriptional ArsR family regulator